MSINSFFHRIRRSLLKQWLCNLGYPKNHIIHYLFDGIRIDPIFKERPLNYRVSYNKGTVVTKSLYDFKKQSQSLNEIFIIGSGPSIRKQALERLQHKNTILLNGAISLIASCKLHPLGIVIIDDSFIRKHINMLNLIPRGTHLFLSFFAIKEIIKHFPSLLQNPIYLVHELKFDTDIVPISIEEKIQQFDKPTWGVFDGGTVMSVAIQIAAFIRAKNVFLLGLDIGNSNTEPRFYENKSNKCRSSLLTDYETKILPFMEVASKWFKINNLSLFNCSPITKLPYSVIPYFDINQITSNSSYQSTNND